MRLKLVQWSTAPLHQEQFIDIPCLDPYNSVLTLGSGSKLRSTVMAEERLGTLETNIASFNSGNLWGPVPSQPGESMNKSLSLQIPFNFKPQYGQNNTDGRYPRKDKQRTQPDQMFCQIKQVSGQQYIYSITSGGSLKHLKGNCRKRHKSVSERSRLSKLMIRLVGEMWTEQSLLQYIYSEDASTIWYKNLMYLADYLDMEAAVAVLSEDQVNTIYLFQSNLVGDNFHVDDKSDSFETISLWRVGKHSEKNKLLLICLLILCICPTYDRKNKR